MRKIILSRIKVLQDKKQEQKVFPSDPNEFELKQAIAEDIDEALSELVAEGIITVNGRTGNKHRILRTS
ncbi:hypothetical protein [Bacteroides propionicifaciens]|uniref:hypothetical protein n=1 Tax=Bacteroides propionicifaciens TaxID=392838 RepID=UPI00036B5D0C|nr:hypothetical protein [Bacteroides propionicifaciens]